MDLNQVKNEPQITHFGSCSADCRRLPIGSPPQGEKLLDLVWSNTKINDFYVNSRFEGMNLVFAGMNVHVRRYIFNVLKYELTRLQV